MKLAFAVFPMTATLGAGSAVLAAGQTNLLMPDPGLVSLLARSPSGVASILTDSDGESGAFWLLAGSDDDEDDDDDGDDCEDDDEGEDDACADAAGSTGNPAKAGSVSPPKNGLFTKGTAPVVKSN